MKVENNTMEISSIKLPPYVGGYAINGDRTNGISFLFTKKPILIHRLFCKLLLGWKWFDQ